jgi:hypothetical protein
MAGINAGSPSQSSICRVQILDSLFLDGMFGKVVLILGKGLRTEEEIPNAGR